MVDTQKPTIRVYSKPNQSRLILQNLSLQEHAPCLSSRLLQKGKFRMHFLFLFYLLHHRTSLHNSVTQTILGEHMNCCVNRFVICHRNVNYYQKIINCLITMEVVITLSPSFFHKQKVNISLAIGGLLNFRQQNKTLKDILVGSYFDGKDCIFYANPFFVTLYASLVLTFVY